jgi:hypothetical protein
VPWGAAELAARQQVVELVNANLQLWPLLDQLTLTVEHENGMRSGVDWCATLRMLKRRHAADANARLQRAFPDTIRT